MKLCNLLSKGSLEGFDLDIILLVSTSSRDDVDTIQEHRQEWKSQEEGQNPSDGHDHVNSVVDVEFLAQSH